MLRLRILAESTDESEVATVTSGYRSRANIREVQGLRAPLVASIGPYGECLCEKNEVVFRGEH